jgi:branched-chain amino acid transport system ATP-binding protein
MKAPVLSLKNVAVKYHGVHALSSVDLDLHAGEIVALMGPNGAGKSTILKAIFGLVALDEGGITWKGKPISRKPSLLIKAGLSYVPQGRRVFPSLSVLENIEMGGIGLPDKTQLQNRIETVLQIFPVLRQKLRQPSGQLSGGQQQMVALARALIFSPEVLLLDEPSIGLSPRMVKEIFAQIQKIHQAYGTTILVVEHNLKSLIHLVDRAYLLEKGRIVASGSASEIIHSDAFKYAFLGREIV